MVEERGHRTGSTTGTYANASMLEKLQAGLPRGSRILGAKMIGRDRLGLPIWQITYVPYKPVGQYMVRATSAPSLVKKNIIVSIDSDGSHRRPVTSGQGVERGMPGLEGAKDRWLAWVDSLPNSYISGATRNSFSAMIHNWKGDAASLNRHMMFIERNAPFGAIGVEQGSETDTGSGAFPINFGGGGGGFAEPVYRAPDRRVVEDFVKGVMISLLGTVDESLIKPAANLYMKDHRRNFDSEGQEIDPSQSVLEHIRNTAAYQSIHALRPDSEDERTWISERRSAAAQGGLQTDLQEGFAITQATVGGTLRNVAEGASAEQFRRSASFRGTLLEDRIRNVASAVYRRVK